MQENRAGALKWAQIIKNYTQLQTLDAQILLSLVDYIAIGDNVKTGGQCIRDVTIVYRYVGDLGKLESLNPRGRVVNE